MRDSPEECIKFELYSEALYSDIEPKCIGVIEMPLYLFSESGQHFDVQLPFVCEWTWHHLNKKDEDEDPYK